MTLTTHIIIAAAVAKPLAAYNPIFAFLVAFASHYLSDAIPHWDYPLQSASGSVEHTAKHIVFTKATFWNDILRAGADGAIGSIAVFLLLRPTAPDQYLFLVLVIAGGILPDFLQGVYYGLRIKLLRSHQNFHDRMHTKIKLGPYPMIGIPFQLLIIALSIFFLV